MTVLRLPFAPPSRKAAAKARTVRGASKNVPDLRDFKMQEEVCALKVASGAGAAKLRISHGPDRFRLALQRPSINVWVDRDPAVTMLLPSRRGQVTVQPILGATQRTLVREAPAHIPTKMISNQ
jgi:hypothetical protein